MNIEERIALNTQKLSGIQFRTDEIANINPEALIKERSELILEALRLDGENRVLNEQLQEKPKEKLKKGE